MSDQRHDPLEILADPARPLPPRPAFTAGLRERLLEALAIDNSTIELPQRKPTMTAHTTTTSPTTGAPNGDDVTGSSVVVPYLAVADGAEALDWYVDALGATEAMRVVGDDGRLGHAEFAIGTATFYLSDEYPEIRVQSPSALGGTTVTLHLTVADVDQLFARAVDRGAVALKPPADQPHGARHGTLIDPFGHRWMLSQPIEQVDVDTYRERAADDGFAVSVPSRAAPSGQIWAALVYADARAGIRFLTEVLGFEEQIVVASHDDPDVIEHSQLRWPEGGVVQAATVDRPGNVYSQRPVGSGSLYVVTADPHAVWERCRAAGVEIVDRPQVPDYAPDTMVFSIRDPEGNIFSFGSYRGEG